jgi:hypothetical protein
MMRQARQTLSVQLARPVHGTLDFDEIDVPPNKRGVEVELTVGVRLRDERLLDAYATITPTQAGWRTSAKVELFDEGPVVLWSSGAEISHDLTAAGTSLERAALQAFEHLVELAGSIDS